MRYSLLLELALCFWAQHALAFSNLPSAQRCRRRLHMSEDRVPVDDAVFHEKLRQTQTARQQQQQQQQQQRPKTFWEKVDEVSWDLFYGRKERQWNPDQRPLDQRGRYDKSKSKLSWGRGNDQITAAALDINSFQLTEAALQQLQEEQPLAADGNDEQTDSPFSGPFVLQESALKHDEFMQAMGQSLELLAAYSDVPRSRKERTLEPIELAELCYAKYEKYHDLSIYSAQPFGKEHRQVAFNIYGPALGDANFPFTEDQYLQKLGTVCQMLNQFDQAWYVRQFLKEPVKPRRGLPSRPRFDTAVTLRLNASPTFKFIPPATLDEWFQYM